MIEIKRHPEKVKFDNELRAKYSRKKESLIERIIRHSAGRKILIWGACSRAEALCMELKSALERQGQPHLWAGFVDSNPEIIDYKGEACNSPSIIDAEKYFIIFALKNRYEKIDVLLSERGYQEDKDYFYYLRTNEAVITQVNGYYCDNFGNEIIGNVKKCNISIIGCENLIVLHPDNHNLDYLDIHVRGNCAVYIEKTFPFGEGYKDKIFVHQRGSISIGRGTSFNDGVNFYVGNDMYVRVGKDCMFAAGVLVRCGLAHQLFYLDEETNVTLEEIESKMILLGDHVWIGQDAKLFSGARIGSGSVVGMGAFVNKEFPENCSIVGVPAKIGRRGVAWGREFRYDATAEDFKDFDFR